jgi:hypothetical protein
MIKSGGWLEGSLGNCVEDRIQFPMLLLLPYDGSTEF